MGNTAYTETLELAGRIIMENGGETYRVEETITRMGKALQLEHVESFAVPSGVFISYRKDGKSESAIIRVRRKGTNLSRIDRVNHISRRLEQGDLDVEGALTRLREAENSPALLPPVAVAALAGLSSGAFAIMFGGQPVDFCVSLVVAFLVYLLGVVLERRRITGFMFTMIGGFFTSLIPMIFHDVTQLGSTFAMIAGALMPLVPGVAMTNAVQDTLRGDLLAGVAHCAQAILTATLMAVGALLGLGLFQLMGGVV